MSNPYRVNLLGRVEFCVRDQVINEFKTTKVRDLLLLLALSAGRPVPRRDLIRWLWPEEESENEKNRLSVTLYLLRSGVSSIGGDPEEVFQSGRQTMRMVALPSDLNDFEALVGEAKGAAESGEPALARDRAMAALQLIHGPVGGSLKLSWCEVVRQRVRASALEMAILIADSGAAESFEGSMAGFERIISVDPGYAEVYEAAIRHCLSSSRLDTARDWGFRWQEAQARSSEPKPRGSAIVPHLLPARGIPSASGEPTLTAILVDKAAQVSLAEAALQHGLLPQEPGIVLAANPLIARDVARDVLLQNHAARVLVCTLIMSPESQVPARALTYHRAVPPGQVWVTRGTAALIDEHTQDAVFEKVEAKGHYRLR